LSLHARNLLCLDRTFDTGENLTLLNPIPGINIDAQHLAAFADDPHGNFSACGKNAGRIDLTLNHAVTRYEH